MYITQENSVKTKQNKKVEHFFYHAQRASHPTQYSIHTNTAKYIQLTYTFSHDSTLHIVFSQTKAWGITDFSLAVVQQNAEGQCQCTVTTEVGLQRFPISGLQKGSPKINADKKL